MNILLLAPEPFFQHRGTPIAVKLLLQVLAEDGNGIHVLTYHEGEDVYIPNTKIHRIPKLPGIKNIMPGPSWKKLVCDVFLFSKSFSLIRKYQFDLIHAVEESVFLAMILGLLFRIPFVYDMDSSFTQQMINKYRFLRPIRSILDFIVRIAIKRSVGVVAVCRFLEKMVLNMCPEKRIVRLEDISLLQDATQRGESLKSTFQIKGHIVMYIGNLEEYQGIDLLIESFKLASEKATNMHLVIIGGSENAIRDYKSKAIALGLKNKTHFLGPRPVSQLASFLEQADILVSPRIKGGNTPMKIYSYLDSGRPLLATRLQTHTQVLDEKIALLVPPEKSAMAEGMISLIKNHDFSMCLAGKAKERVMEQFSYQAFQKKLLGFYKSLKEDIAGS
jgi:glycosyltransferase involved in cell wall biosynthesis